MALLWKTAVEQWVDHESGPHGYKSVFTQRGDQIIGRLDYEVNEKKEAHVGYVDVHSDHRRQGVARKMYDALHEKHPDVVIHHDNLTKDGLGLVKTLPKEWNHIPHKETLEGLTKKVGPTCNANFAHTTHRGQRGCWDLDHQAYASCPVHENDEDD